MNQFPPPTRESIRQFWQKALAQEAKDLMPLQELMASGVIDLVAMEQAAPGEMLLSALLGLHPTWFPGQPQEGGPHEAVLEQLLAATPNPWAQGGVLVERILRLGWEGWLDRMLDHPLAPSASLLDQHPGPRPLLHQAIHQPACGKNAALLDRLLKYGLSPDILDNKSEPALFVVKSMEQVNTLHHHGANLHLQSLDGTSIGDAWSQRFTLADGEPFARWWRAHQPSLTDDDRIRAAARQLSLATKGRAQETWRRYKIKGDERTSTGESFLHLLNESMARQLLPLEQSHERDVQNHFKQEAVSWLVEKVTPVLAQDASATQELAMVLWALQYATQQLQPALQVWAVDEHSDIEEITAVARRLPWSKEQQQRAMAELAGEVLFSRDDKWRPWTQKGRAPGVSRWVVLAARSSRLSSTYRLCKSCQDWLLDVTVDPWDIALGLWQQRWEGDSSYFVHSRDAWGLPVPDGHHGAFQGTLPIRLLLETDRVPLPETWDNWKGRINEGAQRNPSQIPQGFVSEMERRLLQQGMDSDAPSSIPTAIRRAPRL